ncbi:MAG: hypothetical protein IT537_28735 [Hyphomicrobiales bacterium]|nr:hypothetical protein [Hyphomicrobiales bacterium]
MILYTCPVTGRQVRSELQTSAAGLARLGSLKISLWCPHCDAPHSIPANEITASLFGDSEMEHPPR